MGQARLIAKVRNCLYLFLTRLPLGGVWTPDEAAAINALLGRPAETPADCSEGSWDRWHRTLSILFFVEPIAFHLRVESPLIDAGSFGDAPPFSVGDLKKMGQVFPFSLFIDFSANILQTAFGGEKVE